MSDPKKKALIKTIKTTVPLGTYKKLAAARKAAGLPSISALFLHQSGFLTQEKKIDEIVDRAIRAAKNKPPGTEFVLRDLLPATWENYSTAERIKAGKLFNGRVSASVDGIRAAKNKSSSNHQVYVVA